MNDAASAFPWRGLYQHARLTLRLNFRSHAPLIYGYLVPVFFLLAFGSVFRAGTPPLLREMGQLLTITVLGGACFGLPTAMVAERDRGVWRRYRLLPGSAQALLLSACAVRVILVASAAAIQWGLAWCLYRTPWPACPGQFVLAFTGVCLAFLGVGLVIAMLADNVPAVQAIGQCIFLPMILIGGVGVPLRILPAWAQGVAGFLPGRYAVEALNACIVPDGGGLARTPFALAALSLIGAAGLAAASGLFRWDIGPRPLSREGKGWVTLAFAAWLLVGGLAKAGWDRPEPTMAAVILLPAPGEPWRHLSDADLAAIGHEDLPPDEGIVAPVAATLDGLDSAAQKRLTSIKAELAVWPPGRAGMPDERVRALLSVCAVADLAEDENEGEIALTVFEYLRGTVPAPALARVLAWIALHPLEGLVRTDASEFGVGPPLDPAAVRGRCGVYAKKFLWRLRRGS